MSEGGADTRKLIAINVDDASLAGASPESVHEREIAIYDLLADNSFAIPGDYAGPYRLRLGLARNRLAFEIQNEGGTPLIAHLFAMGPFRPLVSDYLAVCGRHHAAIRSASPSQIEAIDMGRRGMHNDAARLLMERLNGKIEVDFATARRLFTLIVALHWDR